MISDRITEYDLAQKFIRVGFEFEKAKEIVEHFINKPRPNEDFIYYNYATREFTWSDQRFLEQLILNND